MRSEAVAADWSKSCCGLRSRFTELRAPRAPVLSFKGAFMLKLTPKDFNAPAILLGGPVDYEMYKDFRAQLDRSTKEGLVVTELSTLGGDPEVARMMGEDIRFHSENLPNCRFVFLGKAAIYSAGTTFMSFFAVENRYLTRGTRLMIS